MIFSPSKQICKTSTTICSSCLKPKRLRLVTAVTLFRTLACSVSQSSVRLIEIRVVATNDSGIARLCSSRTHSNTTRAVPELEIRPTLSRRDYVAEQIPGARSGRQPYRGVRQMMSPRTRGRRRGLLVGSWVVWM
jgi:hypothetical protein